MSVVRRIWVLVVGVLFVVAGLWVQQSALVYVTGWGGGEALVGTPSPQPLGFASFFIATPSAAVLFLIGIILVVGWVGYQIGRRRRTIS